MKSRLLLLLLVFWIGSFGQSVPNTTTFSLQDVCNVVGGDDLIEAFSLSVDSYFDPSYKGNKTNLLNFRNYTITAYCPSIGESYQGGIVVYKFVSGDPGYVSGQCHGIIMSSSTTGTSPDWQWGCSGTTISGADGIELGTGMQNTIDIINGCSETAIAAKLCYDYTSGTYDDWWLPSKDELHKIFQFHIAYPSIGGIPENHYHWSSSEYSSTSAWNAEVTTFIEWAATYKFNSARDVRAIRYF